MGIIPRVIQLIKAFGIGVFFALGVYAQVALRHRSVPFGFLAAVAVCFTIYSWFIQRKVGYERPLGTWLLTGGAFFVQALAYVITDPDPPTWPMAIFVSVCFGALMASVWWIAGRRPQ